MATIKIESDLSEVEYLDDSVEPPAPPGSPIDEPLPSQQFSPLQPDRPSSPPQLTYIDVESAAPPVVSTDLCNVCLADNREEIISTITLAEGKLEYSLLLAPREHIRQFLTRHLARLTLELGMRNALDKVFENGQTLLHGSVLKNRFDITDLFLMHGANIDIMENGKTLAHLAAETNNTFLLRVLFVHGANMGLYNSQGETPLLTAMVFSHFDILTEFWIRATNFKESRRGETVLHYAAKYNHIDAARSACQAHYQVPINQLSLHEKRSALHLAVKYNRVELVRLLLSNKALDETRDVYGKFAFNYISIISITDLFLQFKYKIGNIITRSQSKQLNFISEPSSRESMENELRNQRVYHSLYDPIDKSNHVNWLVEAEGFPDEVLTSEAFPIEPEIPTDYIQLPFSEKAPKVNYTINSAKDFRLHITLLNDVYTRNYNKNSEIVFRRDLYEKYMWERHNIQTAMTEYRTTYIEKYRLNKKLNNNIESENQEKGKKLKQKTA